MRMPDFETHPSKIVQQEPQKHAERREGRKGLSEHRQT